ncbi:hypothetical protein [Sulfitobacter sp. PS-8MA]|uniref:hypothetical protein n=1 Tax=Sulfitobacter sp. PS-8MA TaxID=3237707 RepID=UPI0034C65221
MKTDSLLLERTDFDQPELTRVHKVIMMRSNLRWCTEGLKFTSWNDDVIHAAYLLDAHDREVTG